MEQRDIEDVTHALCALRNAVNLLCVSLTRHPGRVSDDVLGAKLILSEADSHIAAFASRHGAEIDHGGRE